MNTIPKPSPVPSAAAAPAGRRRSPSRNSASRASSETSPRKSTATPIPSVAASCSYSAPRGGRRRRSAARASGTTSRTSGDRADQRVEALVRVDQARDREHDAALAGRRVSCRLPAGRRPGGIITVRSGSRHDRSARRARVRADRDHSRRARRASAARATAGEEARPRRRTAHTADPRSHARRRRGDVHVENEIGTKPACDEPPRRFSASVRATPRSRAIAFGGRSSSNDRGWLRRRACWGVAGPTT